MRFHLPTSCAIGLAFAATMAGVANAQQSTQQHIPVRKEADTTAKADTTTMPAPAPMPMPAPPPAPEPAPVTTTTVDTTTVATTTYPAPDVDKTHMYFGLGGGVVVPVGYLRDVSKLGYTGTAMLGWQHPSALLGFRIDGSYIRLPDKDSTGVPDKHRNRNIETGLLNLTLNFPMGDSKSAFYLLGGGGVTHIRLTDGVNPTTKPAADAGAGINFGLGGMLGFIEGRGVFTFTPKKLTTMIPVIVGLKWTW